MSDHVWKISSYEYDDTFFRCERCGAKTHCRRGYPDPAGCSARVLRIGPAHPGSWWDDHSPKGNCAECGGQCDGLECGLHAAGCIFGGFAKEYWLIADGCPLFHGEVKNEERVNE